MDFYEAWDFAEQKQERKRPREMEKEQKIARLKRESATASSSKPNSSDHGDDLEVWVVVFSFVENHKIY